jgi:stage VI sporulation protein D
MSQDHPSKLSFSIEESVWLNKGQEIAEVVSMSLEPEISIEENEDHVYIKGGLQLVGEYRPVNPDEEIDVMGDALSEQVTFRPIEEVSLSEDAIGEVKHYFPIDVTIPLNRIKNLDDVFVHVESFDYDLPERSCIQLTADVTISGMSAEQTDKGAYAPTPEHTEPAYSAPPIEEREEPTLQSFRFEARKAEEDDEAVEQPSNEFEASTEAEPTPEPVPAPVAVRRPDARARPVRRTSECGH